MANFGNLPQTDKRKLAELDKEIETLEYLMEKTGSIENKSMLKKRLEKAISKREELNQGLSGGKEEKVKMTGGTTIGSKKSDTMSKVITKSDQNTLEEKEKLADRIDTINSSVGELKNISAELEDFKHRVNNNILEVREIEECLDYIKKASEHINKITEIKGLVTDKSLLSEAKEAIDTIQGITEDINKKVNKILNTNTGGRLDIYTQEKVEYFGTLKSRIERFNNLIDDYNSTTPNQGGKPVNHVEQIQKGLGRIETIHVSRDGHDTEVGKTSSNGDGSSKTLLNDNTSPTPTKGGQVESGTNTGSTRASNEAQSGHEHQLLTSPTFGGVKETSTNTTDGAAPEKMTEQQLDECGKKIISLCKDGEYIKIFHLRKPTPNATLKKTYQ